MGVAFLLYGVAIVLVVVVFPIVCLTTVLRTIWKNKENGCALDWKSLTYAILKGFLYASLAIIITVFVILLVLVFIDLSIS